MPNDRETPKVPQDDAENLGMFSFVPAEAFPALMAPLTDPDSRQRQIVKKERFINFPDSNGVGAVFTLGQVRTHLYSFDVSKSAGRGPTRIEKIFDLLKALKITSEDQLANILKLDDEEAKLQQLEAILHARGYSIAMDPEIGQVRLNALGEIVDVTINQRKLTDDTEIKKKIAGFLREHPEIDAVMKKTGRKIKELPIIKRDLDCVIMGETDVVQSIVVNLHTVENHPPVDPTRLGDQMPDEDEMIFVTEAEGYSTDPADIYFLNRMWDLLKKSEIPRQRFFSDRDIDQNEAKKLINEHDEEIEQKVSDAFNVFGVNLEVIRDEDPFWHILEGRRLVEELKNRRPRD